MPTYPTVDECRERLHRAGWSVGEVAGVFTWLVTGSIGENAIRAEGHTQAAAWWAACVQARAVGMLAETQKGSVDE